MVISSGGFVQVGSEGHASTRAKAIVWPAGVTHGAYTDGTEMRAIVVERVNGADDAWARGASYQTRSPRPTVADEPAEPAVAPAARIRRPRSTIGRRANPW